MPTAAPNPEWLEFLTDAALAARAADRTDPAAAEAAFQQLFNRWNNRLIRYLERYAPSNAQEVAQDAWIKVWMSLDRFDGRNFGGWLFKIGRNVTLDELKKRRVKTVSLHAKADGSEDWDPADPRDEPPRDEGFLDDVKAAYDRCVQRLKPDERQVFQARFAGGSPQEVADQLGVLVDRVHSLVHKAKAKLRECMGASLR